MKMGPELRKKILTAYPSWHRQPLRLSVEEMRNPIQVVDAFFEIYNLPDLRACLRQWLEDVQSSESAADHLVTCEHVEKLIEAAWLLRQAPPVPETVPLAQQARLPIFDSLDIKAPIHVLLRPGSKEPMQGSPGLSELLELRTVGSTLVVELKANEQNEKHSLVLPCQELTEIRLCDHSSLRAAELLEASELRLELRGNAEMHLCVDTVQLQASLKGESVLTLFGTTQVAGFHLAERTELRAYDLTARAIHLSSGGNAIAQVSASRQIEGCLCGNAKLSYSGDPKVDVMISEKAKVEKKEKEQPEEKNKPL